MQFEKCIHIVKLDFRFYYWLVTFTVLPDRNTFVRQSFIIDPLIKACQHIDVLTQFFVSDVQLLNNNNKNVR